MKSHLNNAALLLLLSVAVSPVVAQQETPSEVKARIGKIEACLPPPVIVTGDPSSCTSLIQRMEELHVHGVSIAVVHHGVLEFARGYGQATVGGEAVTPDTLFQAGSISKPLAATAALRLVQDHKLALDTDVNAKLTSWKLPASSTSPDAAVTLRELLTHTGGITVHGFPGYAAGEPVPTLVQVLDGVKPANTAPIRLESNPGAVWNYSGGGYTIMQQLLIDVSGEPFSKLMRDTVLKPMGMTHSTYEQPLPKAMFTQAATPYKSNGQPIPGGAHTYPEGAAAGLWTTPSDLAQYIMETQQSLHGNANHVLSQASTQQMLTPGKGSWGLGVQIGGSVKVPYFTHGGVNEGFESLLVGYENDGDGAVVMTNAENGTRIAAEIMRSIAYAYGWPDFQPAIRTAIKVDPSTLARYAGVYTAAPGHDFTFVMDGDHLFGKVNGQTVEVFPESQTKFFVKVIDLELEFFPDEQKHVNDVVLYQGGHEIKAHRTK